MSTSRGSGRLYWRNSHSNNSRGRGTGRGGFSSRGRGSSARLKPDLVKHPLGKLLTTISNADLTGIDGNLPSSATITECSYAASYNWLDEATPTILVPGKPPLWTPMKDPRRLKPDEGDFFRDPNAARFPSYPTEPAVRAVLKADPAFPTSKVDVFACGSTLGNLLRFVRDVDKPFRFSVEVVGNTVFLVRKENSPRELIDGIHGYGHSFPEAYTTWEADVKCSETHQRVIQYKFGGLTCLLRFESDGYLKDFATEGSLQPTASSVTTLDDDEFVRTFQATSVAKRFTDINDALVVKTSGCEVPQASIFDLKTRSGKWNKEIDLSDFLPVLYIKQIPNFIVAYHDGYGRFDNDGITVRNLEEDINEWEAKNKPALERLVILLRKIIEIAKDDERGLLEVHSPSLDRLEIRQQFGDGSHALPLSLREEWGGEYHGARDDFETETDDALTRANEGADLAKQSDFYDDRSDSDSDDGTKDFTACSVDSCGYCGRCSY